MPTPTATPVPAPAPAPVSASASISTPGLSKTHRGLLFVVSAPSGVGKTTLIRAIQGSWPDLRYSVSCTTRPPRPSEQNGVDYHFITHPEFIAGIRAGRFLEWAEVHGQYYGTDGDRLEEWLAAGKDVLLDIDIQGARQVRCAYPDASTLFILPPSMDVLGERLQGRGTESPEQLARRMAAAEREILEAPWYDYLIVNEALEEAIADFNAVLRASHCTRSYRAAQLKAFLLPKELP